MGAGVIRASLRSLHLIYNVLSSYNLSRVHGQATGCERLDQDMRVRVACACGLDVCFWESRSMKAVEQE